MRRFIRFETVFLVALLLISTASSSYGSTSDTKTLIQSPSTYLGIEIGKDRVLADWTQITRYFKSVAGASPRVRIEEMGKSTNGRTIIAAIITSEENQGKLDQLIDLQKEITFAERRDDENSRWLDNKVFLVINCSIHSSEIGASQMSMQLLHQLVTDESEDFAKARDRLVMILIPSPNPDGIDWMVEWYRKWLGTEYEGNQYPYLYQEYAGHDNNRDWYMLNLPETNVINKYFSSIWYPHIIWDAHQMGGTGYRAFIPPFVGPPNPMIHPMVLTGIENAGHAMRYQMFSDGHKGIGHSWAFSVWWNGGFRTTPYFKNSIGLLTELASARLATPIEIKPEQLKRGRGRFDFTVQTVENPAPWTGGRWGIPEIIAYEMSAAKGLLNFASRNHREIIANYRKMSLDAMEAKDDGPAGYLIDHNQPDQEALHRIIDIVQKHGITVHQLAEAETINEMDYQAGTVVISGYQPFRPMIRSLMEKVFYPITSSKQNPYDVSASTLSLIMNIEVEQVSKDEWGTAGLKLAEYKAHGRNFNRTSTGRTFYHASDSASYRRANELVAGKEYVIPESTGGKGAKSQNFVHYNPNRDASGRDISQDIERAKANSLKPVRLGLLRGYFNNMDEGWTRYLLEKFNFAFKSIDEKRIKDGKLIKDFDAIIIPNIGEQQLLRGRSRGNTPPEYKSGIGKYGLQSLEKFVLDGGTLICFLQSARAVIKNFELPVGDDLRGLNNQEFNIPGSLVRLHIDTEHPIAIGMTEHVAAMFRGALAFSVPASRNNGIQVVARYAKSDTLMSGYARGIEKIQGKAAMVKVKHGGGNIILFGFPPQFRAQTYSTFKLLFNSIYSTTCDFYSGAKSPALAE